MEQEAAAAAFATMGHPGRLQVFRLLMRLAPHGARPTEIARQLGLKQNTLSHYLADLVQAGLVRSARTGRTLNYTVDIEAAAALVGFLVNDCCRGRPEVCLPLPAPDAAGSMPMRVLFLCTANSARSIMAEALLRDLGTGRFIARSAGTAPAPDIHPRTRALLRARGHDLAGLGGRSQPSDPGPADIVISVCDRAAMEDCALPSTGAIGAHWGLPDPALSDDPAGFEAVYDRLHARICALAAIDTAALDRLALQTHLDRIGRL
jgi:ArsR family transcriptional regulator, arsenate/arsenite/antimonite-responsive transcriptional repressor / arsenate reductase (thioredoxin)